IEDHDVTHAELGAGQPLDLVRRLPPRPPRPIDADAEHLAGERGYTRSERLGLGWSEGDGRGNVDGAHACQVPRSTWRSQASGPRPGLAECGVGGGGGAGSVPASAPAGSGPTIGCAACASSATGAASRARDLRASDGARAWRRSAMVRSNAATSSRSSSTFVL